MVELNETRDELVTGIAISAATIKCRPWFPDNQTLYYQLSVTADVTSADLHQPDNLMLTAIQQALGIKTRIESGADKEVLFTFDDGPDPLVTGKILDMLDTVGAKAVFFVVGNRIHKAEHMLREVLDRGHLIGNHSYTHWLGKPPSSSREYLADIEKCQQRIFDVCGYTPTLFRPPLGAVNLATIRTARTLNLHVYKWSFDTNDWRLRDDDTARVEGAELAGRLVHRDVILMHDDNVHTPIMAEEMLRQLSAQQVDLSSFVTAAASQAELQQSA